MQCWPPRWPRALPEPSEKKPFMGRESEQLKRSSVRWGKSTREGCKKNAKWAPSLGVYTYMIKGLLLLLDSLQIIHKLLLRFLPSVVKVSGRKEVPGRARQAQEFGVEGSVSPVWRMRPHPQRTRTTQPIRGTTRGQRRFRHAPLQMLAGHKIRLSSLVNTSTHSNVCIMLDSSSFS